MIDDSVPWKEELLRIAYRLHRKARQRRWTDRSSFLVERDVMVGAYAIRKLVEARKVSDALASQNIAVQEYPLTGRAPDIWRRDEIWKHYDLDSGRDTSISLTWLCNQIIHSFVWLLSAEEPPPHYLNGIYVASDRKRLQGLYYITIETLVRLFYSIGGENIVEATMSRDGSGDMQILRLIARPAPPIEEFIDNIDNR